MNDNKQLDFIDLISIMSFVIAIMNLDENITQSDKQDLQDDLDNKTKLLLDEIHAHLQQQDKQLNKIMEALYGFGILQKTDT